MRLTKSADFALRLMIHLASEQKTLTMPVLSERLGTPYHHLSKLIQALSKAKLVQTRQGKNGGVQIMGSPDQISLKEVLDVIEGPLRLSECMHRATTTCGLVQTCKLKRTFHDLQTNIETFFASVKISQMI